MASYLAPGMAVVGNGYIPGCGTKSYSGVPGLSLCIPSPSPPWEPTPKPSPTPEPTTKDCSRIYVNSSSAATCDAGWEASSEDVQLCLRTICPMMDVWAKAKYADPDMMVVGTGYDATCGPLPKDGGLGDSICVSSVPLPPTPKPTPTPTPAPAPTPLPTPTTAPIVNCYNISVQDGTACASGTRLLELNEVSECMTSICNWISDWSIVGYAVPGSAVVGGGYIPGCGTNTYSGVPGQMLCVSGTPKPTPAPAPTPKPTPTPLPTPGPTTFCSRIYVNSSSAATCDAGWEASSEDVHSCMDTICYMMDVWAKAKYADPDMMVVGTGYDATCGPQPKDGGLGDSICVASSMHAAKPDTPLVRFQG